MGTPLGARHKQSKGKALADERVSMHDVKNASRSRARRSALGALAVARWSVDAERRPSRARASPPRAAAARHLSAATGREASHRHGGVVHMPPGRHSQLPVRAEAAHTSRAKPLMGFAHGIGGAADAIQIGASVCTRPMQFSELTSPTCRLRQRGMRWRRGVPNYLLHGAHAFCGRSSCSATRGFRTRLESVRWFHSRGTRGWLPMAKGRCDVAGPWCGILHGCVIVAIAPRPPLSGVRVACWTVSSLVRLLVASCQKAAQVKN